MVKVMVSPSPNSSCFRTDAFKGKMYSPFFESEKIDVFHDVSPMLALTGMDPKPFDCPLKRDLISAEIFLGTEMKCHADGPLV